MKRRLTLLAALAALAAAAGPAAAASFGEAWAAARGNDAQFRAAGHERDAARQAVPIARASLLPQVNLSLSTSNVTGEREFPNSLGQQVRLPVNYDAPQATISLRQGLFNYEVNARVAQAQAQSDGAEALYRARGYELADRLATAYTSVLLAQEAANLADTQLRTSIGQADRATQRLVRGEGTRVEVARAQATVDVARVRVIEAQDQLAIAREDLQRVTGVAFDGLRRMDGEMALQPLAPAGLDEWVDIAQRQSAVVEVRQQQLEAARFAVERSRAGHLPRLDLVASVSNSRNDSISTLNQRAILTSMGVQFSMPLYSGGGVDASVTQSQSDLLRAESDLRAQREAVAVDVQRYYRAVAAGAAKIEAYRRVVASAELQVIGAERAVDTGLGTTTSVLEAQAQLYVSLRDAAQARYEYLLARLRLFVQAGLPAEDLVADIDRHLTVAAELPRTAKP